MKPSLLLLAFLIAAFSSCTTAYKTGQTPDDVYFSPAPPVQDEYVSVNTNDQRQYNDDNEYYDDRYLRMKVQDRYQWSDLDDWYYYGNRYTYSYYNTGYWNNPWTPYTYWNNYYNPYCRDYIVYSHSGYGYGYGSGYGYGGNYGGSGYNPVVVHPRMYNLNTYNNNMLLNRNYSNPSTPGGTTQPRGLMNSTNNTYRSTNTGNALRNIFNNNNNNSSSNNNNSNNNNSSSGRSQSSTSGSSSSGSSAPVRRF